MSANIHVIGNSKFISTVGTVMPRDKSVHLYPYPSIYEFLNTDKNLEYSLAMIHTSPNIVLIEQISKVLTRLQPFGEKATVFVLSEAPSLEEGIKLVKKGVEEYLCYPKDIIRLNALVSAKCEQWNGEEKVEANTVTQNYGILGNCRQIREIIQQIKKLGLFQKLNVLITGETGTGKELAARAIHHSSSKSDPFIEVNASAIAENLIESELFGHEKGAFTGAHATKQGLFEVAKGGTLFLDEIGDLGFNLQSKLLRAIEQKTIIRVGGTEEIPVSSRIIAATNKDLAEAVRDGKFRQDLYFRLRVAHIHLPPLRERGGDALFLSEHFLQDFCQRFNLRISGFTSGAKQLISEYHWPGNVRELSHAIERAVILAGNDKISKEILQEALAHSTKSEKQEDYSRHGINLKLPLQGATLNEIDNCAIRVTLKLVKGNKRQAAKLLGISPPRLYRKLDQMSIRN